MRRFALLAALFAIACGVSPAHAGLDIDFGAAVPVGDDGQLFVHVSSRLFGEPTSVVHHVAQSVPNPDDVAVALFIGRSARRPPDDVLRLRAQGLPWWDISVRFGVPPDVYFVPVQTDPGPPYGKAYGYWKKHPHGAPSKYALSDAEVRDLVAVRMMHDYYGVSAERAMDWRRSGRDVQSLVGEQYRQRHGKPHGKPVEASNHEESKHGEGGDGGEHGKGHGNGHKK